ncbi:UNVERIFIED_ORG: AcrR family transcriptional regulator [Microbispora rosea subsp. rosea]
MFLRGTRHPRHSITSIAELLGVSVGTLYNHIPDLQELRVLDAVRAAYRQTRPMWEYATDYLTHRESILV